MTLINDIKSFEAKHYLLLFLIYVSVVVSGVLIIFQFKPYLVNQFDPFKLLLLGSSITIPVLCLNTLSILFIFFEEKDDINVSLPVAFTAGSLLTTVILFLALYLSFLLKLNFKIFSLAVISIDILFLILILIVRNKIKKQSKK